MNPQYISAMRGGTFRVARGIILTLLVGALVLTLAVPARAGATSPDLGTAGSFGVLAGSAVTNTGPTTVDGDVGVSPGTSVTGFPPGLASGTIHAGDAVAAQAQSDASTAYNDAAGQPCDTNLTGQDLGGLTLSPGVYCFDSSAQLTGQLTLDGSSSGVFVFQIGSTLTTASNADVSLINGAQPCNVFWQVGSSATLGTNTAFAGNVLALTSITLNTDASTEGGLYARNGAVTLDSNDIQACDFAQPAPTDTPTATSTAPAASTATATAVAPTAANTSTPTASATPVATSTVMPSSTATQGPGPTRAPADTPEPTETVDTPVDTVVPGTATSESTATAATSTPSASGTAINTPTNTITLSTPEATLTGTALSTETPGAPSATVTATLPAGTSTETLVAPSETPVAPQATVLATQVVVPSPPLLLPPTGGGPPAVDGLTWFGPLILLLNAFLLAVALGLRSLLRARHER